ncbi:hypothetical protein Tco_1129100 [Tanacetum coccineum]
MPMAVSTRADVKGKCEHAILRNRSIPGQSSKRRIWSSKVLGKKRQSSGGPINANIDVFALEPPMVSNGWVVNLCQSNKGKAHGKCAWITQSLQKVCAKDMYPFPEVEMKSGSKLLDINTNASYEFLWKSGFSYRTYPYVDVLKQIHTKTAYLMPPFRKIEGSSDIEEAFNWTCEAERPSKNCTIRGKKTGSDTHLLRKSTTSGTINLLYYKGESSTSTNPHNKILDKNLQNIQSQRGDRQHHGGDTKSFRNHQTTGPIGSEIKDIPCLIHSKEGSKKENSENVFWERRASVASTRQEQ